MAGHRRERGEKTQVAKRFRRRRDAFEQRLRSAQSPMERVHAVYRYFTGAVKRARPELATKTADEVVLSLARAADQLLDPRTREGEDKGE